MKIKIEYDDGLPFASHRIAPEDAAAWRALFEGSASLTTRFEGTSGDLKAREFTSDLINATRAAKMDVAGKENSAAGESGAAMPELPAGSSEEWKPTQPSDGDMDAIGAAREAVSAAMENHAHARLDEQTAGPGWVGSIRRFLQRLARGQSGLARTFWGFGFGGALVQGVLIALVIGNAVLLIGIGAVSMLYSVLVWMGIWNAANRYEGSAIWARLAKVTVALAIPSFLVLAALLLAM